MLSDGVLSPDQQPQREFALDVVRRLRAAGFQALWAGGCVRDQLLGLAPKDYDVATNARPEQVRETFGKRRTIPVGAAFGVITVLGPTSCQPVEVATFRSDGQYRDGRHPDSVEFTDAQHDAQRRDFTINGLFYDPVERQVVDYVGGQADLAARIVRAIGDPEARFGEDRLRMLRAVRFAATYDFSLEAATLAAIQRLGPHIAQVSAERIGAELARMLTHPSRPRGLELLAESDLLAHVLPELAPLAAEGGTAWQDVLERSARLGAARLPVGLACALAGSVAPAAARDVVRRLRWTNKDAEQTQWLLERLPDLLRAETLPWPRLQRMLTHSLGPELVELAAAAWGDDRLGVRHARQALTLPPERLNPPPLVTGDDLVAAGLAPGPRLGQLLDRLRDAQLEGHLHTREDAIQLALRGLEEQR